MRTATFLALLASIIFPGYVDARSNVNDRNFLPPDSVPPTLLVVNAFDASAMNARDKKKELFRELADSLKSYLQREAEGSEGVRVIIAPAIVNITGNYDSLVSSLVRQYNASGIIVIKNLNVFFNQTNVEVTKNTDGSKSREASYDICTGITYDGYWIAPSIKSSDVNDCTFFTKRNVISGLFAAGPDVVGKSKHAFKMIYKNARAYILNYFPWN